MKQIISLINKNPKLVVGLMSGTSVDGIDAALVKIFGSGVNTKFELLNFITHKYPKNYKSHLLKNSQPKSGSVDEIAKLNILVSHFFADAVKKVCGNNKIDLIGSHGQTIHHLPKMEKYFGKNISATFQIGDTPTLAKLTGVPVVSNFRTADMAFGGQGAPLVPYFDWITLRSEKENRAVLNIGGISNITYLKKNGKLNDVKAFDTGPGNMIIDYLVQKYFNKQFDENGEIARNGLVKSDLLKFLMSVKYFLKPLPKSTGRELFSKNFIENFILKFNKIKPEDLISTATEFTAISIYSQYKKLLSSSGEIETLIVSGGGVKNKTLMNSLQKYFYKTKISSSTEFGIDEDAKEAICFAVLANETICGNATNVPSVTGATKSTILGEVAF